MTKRIPHFSHRQRLGLGGAVLLALGAAGGAGAMSLTRPEVAMAPTVTTPVARLANRDGIVTVRGRVAAIYGDRFLVEDASGRALVDMGRGGAVSLTPGSAILVQGRFDDGQLHARYLVDRTGTVREVAPPRPPHGGPHHMAPLPPPGVAGAAPAPPPVAPDVAPQA